MSARDYLPFDIMHEDDETLAKARTLGFLDDDEPVDAEYEEEQEEEEDDDALDLDNIDEDELDEANEDDDDVLDEDEPETEDFDDDEPAESIDLE